MKFENYISIAFPSRSANEAFARSAVACFAAQLDPTLEELGDIRTAVSEAVTNSIVAVKKMSRVDSFIPSTPLTIVSHQRLGVLS